MVSSPAFPALRFAAGPSASCLVSGRRPAVSAVSAAGPFLPLYTLVVYWSVAAADDPLEDCFGFDWDDANTLKNWERHKVTPEEAEDVFFQEPLVIRHDVQHSTREKRYYALGVTAQGRRLFIAFTVRRNLIRVISVRDMNRNETEMYKRHEEEDAT